MAHGVVGGAISEATGGEFRHGFYSGFAGSVAGSLAPRLGFADYSNRNASAIAARTAFAAVVGGTTSVLGGGKFGNGAVTSAFQHLFNHEAAAARLARSMGASTTGQEARLSQEMSKRMYKAPRRVTTHLEADVSWNQLSATVTEEDLSVDISHQLGIEIAVKRVFNWKLSEENENFGFGYSAAQIAGAGIDLGFNVKEITRLNLFHFQIPVYTATPTSISFSYSLGISNQIHGSSGFSEKLNIYNYDFKK